MTCPECRVDVRWSATVDMCGKMVRYWECPRCHKFIVEGESHLETGRVIRKDESQNDEYDAELLIREMKGRWWGE